MPINSPATAPNITWPNPAWSAGCPRTLTGAAWSSWMTYPGV